MSPASERRGIGHFPALDGLRGLALVGVLFFHAQGALPGGYLGVDLFFVLSGFLITSLLLAEHEKSGKIGLSAFWVRRARRLFPALLSLMPAIAIYGRFVAAPSELANLRADAIATLGYVANWRAIFSHKSYWDLFAHPSPLEHTWSLSIEEQFYVVWPLAVLLALRKGSRKTVLAMSLVLLAASMIATLVLFDPENVSRVYLGTDTRASGILSGAILACVLGPGSRPLAGKARTLDAVGFVAIAMLAWAWFNLRGEDPLLYHGGFWITELACLALVVCAVHAENGWISRALSLKPLTLVGTVSYGAYLWHWPVDVIMTPERIHLRGVSLIALQIAITFVIATVSYRLLERPIRRNGVPFGRPIFVVPSAVALALLLVVRATFARPEPPPRPPVIIAPVVPDVVTFRVMMVGDSTANSLGWALRSVQRKGFAVELQGRDGCTMLADTCYGDAWADHVRTLEPNATIVFFGGAFLHGITVKGRWRVACAAPWDEKFESTVQKRLADLKAPNHDVYLATLPYPLGPYDSAPYRKETDCINASLRKAAAANDGVKVLELGARLCPDGECDLEFGGKAIRPDGVHFDIDGARELSKWVVDEIDPEVDAGTLDDDGGQARAP
ncbi:MAG: acyltransferase family protein [Polyangiaceae bacterium]